MSIVGVHTQTPPVSPRFQHSAIECFGNHRNSLQLGNYPCQTLHKCCFKGDDMMDLIPLCPMLQQKNSLCKPFTRTVFAQKLIHKPSCFGQNVQP